MQVRDAIFSCNGPLEVSSQSYTAWGCYLGLTNPVRFVFNFHSSKNVFLNHLVGHVLVTFHIIYIYIYLFYKINFHNHICLLTIFNHIALVHKCLQNITINTLHFDKCVIHLSFF